MKVFRKLALSGGGSKGVLQIGILHELAKHQELVFPDGVYGCSIGAIIATFVAFKLPLKIELVSKYLKYDKVLPKPSFQDITKSFEKKGVFSMDLFTTTILEVFEEAGMNIRDTKIGDALMPLFIVASNITKGIPTLFSKDVLVIDALRCSCCLPGIFKPQDLYGQLYIDGGMFVPCLSLLVPDALTLFLTKKRTKLMTLKSIETMSPIDYLRQLYSMSMNQFHKHHKTPITIELEYPGLTSDSDLGEFDIDKILEHSATVLNNFLRSQSTDEEGAESRS